MNRIFLPVVFTLLCLYVRCQGQKPVVKPAYIVGLGEYQCFIINTGTGKLYGVSNNLAAVGVLPDAGIPGLPVPVQVPDSLRFIDVASGLHNSLAVDERGEVWTWGANNVGESGTGTADAEGVPLPVKIPMDSAGNPFTRVVQTSVWAGSHSNGNVAIKSDGTVWIWGLTGEGMRGNGQVGQVNTRPVQINIPGHRKIIKIIANAIVLALAEDGSVWTWGGNNRKELLGTNTADYTHPHQVPLPQKARDIAGAGFFSYALGVNGRLYGWGYYTAYMCMGTGGWMHAPPPPAAPVDLTGDLRLPHPVSQVMTNSTCTHVILTDGTLWGWGDNTSGGVGNGQEPDYAKHKPPYAWDWGPGQMLVEKPVHLAPSVHDFIKVFGGSAGVFYSYAETSSGQLYSWGRNKTGNLGNGIIGPTPDIVAAYPNSWDVTLVTPIEPFSLKENKIVNSPYCHLHPDDTPCNQFNESAK